MSNCQNDHIYTYSHTDEPPHDEGKFSAQSMVWRAMSASSLPELHIVRQGTTNNVKYHINKILQPAWLSVLSRKKKSGRTTQLKLFNSWSEMVLRQDGANAHTACVTQPWCVDQLTGFQPKEEWPLNYPDLNLIEK